MRYLLTTAVAALALAASPATPAAAAEEAASAVSAENPLLAPWSGPYGGVPAFDRMRLDLVGPALEAAMAKNLAEIDAIADSRKKPTFANTIVELEKAGDDLDRVFAYWGVLSSNMSTPEFRKIQQEMSPKLSEHQSKITGNEKLFLRIKAVYEGKEYKTLKPDQQRLVWLVHNNFVMNGATLSPEAKARNAEINKALAAAQTKFSNNVLADEENYVTYITKKQLGGLPAPFVKAAAAAAEQRGRKGEYAVTNTRSSMDPFLTYSTDRALREKVWRTYYDRGDNGNATDNNALIVEILKLRNERVRLQGYDNYAAWRLQDRMAKTPERAMTMMETVWPAAIARAKEEIADMQAVADAGKARIRIEPWDYRFYAEKVRKAKYDLSSDEVREYLQLDKLREAMFYVAGELFNFSFAPVADGAVPVWQEDVKVWEVTDRTTGAHIGLWYLDPFARQGKRSGAWASGFRGHETFAGAKTVLSTNNSNFVKGAPGEPVLISWDDAETFFHEMGHALHALSSNVAYPTLNGGVRDYTEFQSQLLERWLLTDPVIGKYLVHYKTGAPMPADLVARIKKAATFNQGFATTEYLASALVDLKLHMMTNYDGFSPDAYERETLAALGLPSQIVMRHRTPQFTHVFASEGYAAGYYGYMWADVLTSDAAEAFEAAPGGFYDKPLAQKLVSTLFAPRNAIDPAEAYRQFRGRDADIAALMRDRGFPVSASKTP